MVEDRYVLAQTSSHVREDAIGFVGIVQITQIFAGLYQTLKSSTVPLHSLHTFEELIQSKFLLFPMAYQPDSDAYLPPAALSLITTLQVGRFQLHRRNLSPMCPPHERGTAINSCVAVAHDTAKYISRTLCETDPEKSWQRRIKQIASNLICIHMWRCMLILCLRGDYKAALMCVRVSATIGDARKINTACGKNVLFFLDQVMERTHRVGSHVQVENDEEMLAYASGDLQSSLEHSWAWAGAVDADATHPSSHHSMKPAGAAEALPTMLPLRLNTSPVENGVSEWAGWGQVEHVMKILMSEQQPRIAAGPAPTYYPPPHNPMKRVQLAPEAPPVSPAKPKPASDSSRMSIANII